MTEMLRTWLTSAVAVSFLTAIAERLTPEGSVKRMQRVCCGLLWLLVLFRPALVTFSSFPPLRVTDISERIEAQAEEYRKENGKKYGQVIESETKTYIEAQAKERGFTCTAEVRAEVTEDGTGGEIRSVLLSGTCDDAFLEEMAGQLGIDRSLIQRKEGEE